MVVNSSRGWLVRIVSCPTICAVILGILIQIFGLYRENQSVGWPYAVTTVREDVRNPTSDFSRFRGRERPENNFMQWYYALVHDSETEQTWTFAIGAFRKTIDGNAQAVAWVKSSASYNEEYDDNEIRAKKLFPEKTLLEGGRYRDVGGISAIRVEPIKHSFPLSCMKVSDDMNVDIIGDPSITGDAKGECDETNSNTSVMHSLRTNHASLSDVDENIQAKYSFNMNFPESSSSVNITLRRVYGFFGGHLMPRHQNVTTFSHWSKTKYTHESTIEDKCVVDNIPFAYNSEVEGTITIHGRTYTFNRSSRFRAYLETTWSCTYPQGKFPTDEKGEYPWKWQWLVLPEAGKHMTHNLPTPSDIPADISVLFGWARLYFDPVKGSVSAAYITVDTPEDHLSAKFSVLWDKDDDKFGMTIPLEFSTTESQGRLIAFDCGHDDWQRKYEDKHGVAGLPRAQSVYLETTKYVVIIHYLSNIGSYVRLAVLYQIPSGEERVCSDFRGMGGDVRLSIYRKRYIDTYPDTSDAQVPCNKATYLGIEELQSHEFDSVLVSRIANQFKSHASDKSAKVFTRTCMTKSVHYVLEQIYDGPVMHKSIEFSYHAPFAKAQ